MTNSEFESYKNILRARIMHACLNMDDRELLGSPEIMAQEVANFAIKLAEKRWQQNE